jgi:uncharacterized protein
MSAAPEQGALHEAQRAFAAHIRDPEHVPLPRGIEPRRMKIYSDLFFNNIESLLAANFPVIRTLHDDDAWRALVRDFYRGHRSHTPLFTEIAREFIRHLEWRVRSGAGDPPFLVELAHYEWSELALTLDEHDIASIHFDRTGDLLTGIPVVSPLARVLAYNYPVHLVAPDFRPTEASPQPVFLLLVRDRADEVHFLEIDALTALLMERLSLDSTEGGLARIDGLLAELGRGGEGGLRESGIAILRHLHAREVVLGTLPA